MPGLCEQEHVEVAVQGGANTQPGTAVPEPRERQRVIVGSLLSSGGQGGSRRKSYAFFFFFSFSCFLGSHLRHMEVPRQGVTSELQLPAYTMATAMREPRFLCDLHCSSRILNPVSEARD